MFRVLKRLRIRAIWLTLFNNTTVDRLVVFIGVELKMVLACKKPGVAAVCDRISMVYPDEVEILVHVSDQHVGRREDLLQKLIGVAQRLLNRPPLCAFFL